MAGHVAWYVIGVVSSNVYRRHRVGWQTLTPVPSFHAAGRSVRAYDDGLSFYPAHPFLPSLIPNPLVTAANKRVNSAITSLVAARQAGGLLAILDNRLAKIGLVAYPLGRR